MKFYPHTSALVSSVLLTFGFISAAAQPIYTSNEISNLQIKTICQDSMGYIWIGTARGLNKYNGSNFTHYFYEPDNPESLPHNCVNKLYNDNNNQLWIGTSVGLCRYDLKNEQITRYNIIGEEKPYMVLSITEDHNQNLWLGTYLEGILLLKNGESILTKPDGLMNFETSVISSLSCDRQDNLWFGIASEPVLGKYDIGSNTQQSYKLPDGRTINCLTIDQDGKIWLGTNRGLLLFDSQIGEFDNFPPELDQFYPELSEENIMLVESISTQKLVISTKESTYLFDTLEKVISKIESPGYQKDFEYKEIQCAFEDNDKNIWLGSFNRGVNILRKNRLLFNTEHKPLNRLHDRFVTACDEDSEGKLWFGTRYHGLYYYDKNLGRTNNISRRNNTTFAALKSDFIQSILCDSKGHIWLGVGQNIIKAEMRKENFSVLATYENLGDIVCIEEDEDGDVWFGSSNSGLFFSRNGNSPPENIEVLKNTNVTKLIAYSKDEMIFNVHGKDIFIINKHTKELKPFFQKPHAYGQITDCVTMYADQENNLWIGSYSYGLLKYNFSSKEFDTFTVKEGLPSNDVLGITKDDYGRLWISTSFGLSCMNPEKKRFYNFASRDGLQNSQFHEKALLKSRDGYIYAGGNFGVDRFLPSEIIVNTIVPRVIFEDIKVNNNSITPGDNSPLDVNITYASEISLNNKQSSFIIDFIGIDFSSPDMINYFYKLEGFDNDWIESGNFRRASYTNVPAGKYKFTVRAVNDEGGFSHDANLDIIIKSSPLLSVWAIAGYIILGIFIICYSLKLYISAKYSKISYTLSEEQRKKEQRANRRKINFYNNISHELRTPLTLISGNLDLFTRDKEFSPQDSKYLSLTIFNVNRLLKLINQLLDFSKIEYETLELKVSDINVSLIVKNIAETFIYSVNDKKINYKEDIQPDIIAWVDEDKLEKILTNLLSNAVKYSPQKGEIHISTKLVKGEKILNNYAWNCDPNQNYVHLKISNTHGKIADEKLKEIFTRYTRLNNVNAFSGNKGMGIGLHYTKSIIETHKGFIEVRSLKNYFVVDVVLPSEKIAYNESEIMEKPFPIVTQETKMNKLDLPDLNSKDCDLGFTKGYTILIIEDDPGIHKLLQDLLGSSYHLLHAYDGIEALEIIKIDMPDLILSDVLMKEMDGLQLCRIVKTDLQLSHIMIILLTAKSRSEDIAEGYLCGADAYVSKPFDSIHLMAMIKGLLKNRERVRIHLGTEKIRSINEITKVEENPKDNNSKIRLSELDRKFLDKLNTFIDNNIEKTEININIIAVELGFSRTSFYRKLKSLTGMSPYEYVRNFKMKKAASLIAEGSLSFAEISDQTGFGTQSHFSTSFKKYYGISPRDFKEQQKVRNVVN